MMSPTPQTESSEVEEIQVTQMSGSGLSTERPQVSLPRPQPSPLLQSDIPGRVLDSEAASPIESLSHEHDLPIHLIRSPLPSTDQVTGHPNSEDEGEPLTDWSRSPSPVVGLSGDADAPRPPSTSHDAWDAAQEMDPHAEEGEFARFMSQVKGRDLDDVRAEIDKEIKSLNQQKKAAMRDSDDITQQMISQIMVR